MGDDVEVRRARPADGPGMGRVHVRAWQVGYAGLLPEAHLASLDPDERGRQWTAGLDRPRSAWAAEHLVAVDRDEVVGIASFGPYRPDEAETTGSTPVDQLAELWQINVEPERWGTGVAQALMAAVLDGLRQDHVEPMAALWVLDGNARGRRFYDKIGWRADGATKADTIGDATVTEVRYVIDLREAAP